MRKPLLRNWSQLDLSKPIVSEPTPPALLALMVAAVQWPEAAAWTPYCGCGHVVDALSSAGLETRYLAMMVPAASSRIRAALTRTWDPGSASATDPYSTLETATGGTGNDATRTSWPTNQDGKPGAGKFQGQWPSQLDVTGADSTATGVPTSPQDRMPEVLTRAFPYVEAVMVTKVSGISLVVAQQIEDVEAL